VLWGNSPGAPGAREGIKQAIDSSPPASQSATYQPEKRAGSQFRLCSQFDPDNRFNLDQILPWDQYLWDQYLWGHFLQAIENTHVCSNASP
jgi:hypothetical protein